MATSPPRPIDDSLRLLIAGGVPQHIVDRISPEVWAQRREGVIAQLEDEQTDRFLRRQAAEVLSDHLLREDSRGYCQFE